MPEAPKPTEVITQVRTVHQVQFFGITGTQVSATQGVVLTETKKGIRVTHPGYPGEVRVIWDANIVQVTYSQEVK